MLWRERHPDEATLVAECEAYLAGRLVEHLLAAELPVPRWAWTNLLAHGSRAQLADPKIHRRDWEGRELAAWSRARAYLAGEVLDLAGTAEQLRSLQTALLVPLELQLARKRSTRPQLDPGGWATSILRAMDSTAPQRPQQRR